MLLVSCWALSNFVTFVSWVSYSHDRESRTHHLHMQKLPHWKNSISIPSTHAYPFWCSICHKVSSQNSLQQRHELCIEKKRKKGAHEGPWKRERERWTKVHAKNKKISHVQKKYEEEEIKSWNILLSYFPLHPPHIHTHTLLDHGCMTCLLFRVRSLTLQNIWNKYALVFLPTLSSTNSL